MKKLLATAFVVTLMSSGSVMAESILGDPAGAVTRHVWGMDADPGYASNPASPEPLAQVPITTHGAAPEAVSQAPVSTGHSTGRASDSGSGAQ